MGKAISVNLPNGREWQKKGDAEQHFRGMLNRYVVGQRVDSPSDHSDLVALLTVYDAGIAVENSKIGSGVVFFEKDIDYAHPGRTTCFFVVRLDGTRIDFSLGRALDAAAGLTP